MNAEQLLILIVAGIGLWVVSIRLSIGYEKKGWERKKAWTIPSLVLGAGVALVISYLVEATLQETLLLLLGLTMFSYFNSLVIHAGREKLQAMLNNRGNVVEPPDSNQEEK
ncbi:hypothetical protein [Desulforamulus aquiferis]|uniref:Uncharacterized protein n=1 Tax=Desulforamulus aquiferis TaxID=1397668 RepID=A0AAW7ZH73_9FIRM|nr:hypothetical protein [Desulforamulus aquiferis]MDO7788681.1 hypothetical protein [Desulforamulus aquiferis]